MKNKLLYSVMALCIGLFFACSQDDVISQSEGGNEVVNISAVVPQSAGIDTRAMPTVPAGYQLRCILEVWDKANAAATAPITRIEKLTAADNGGKFSFSFSVDKDVDYQCLLWADYIATDAATSTTTDGNTKYADKHYNTANLKAIGVIADNSLFNNKACDAFCGAVGKSESGLSITLERSFAELTVKEKEASKAIIEACTGLEVSYDMPSGYNIATGTTSATVKVNYSGTVPGKADRVWFSNYVFAPENVTALGAVEMNIKTAATPIGYKRTIPANALTLDKNRQVEASGNFSEDSNVDVDVDIDGGFTDPNAPQVGYIYYSDGTWSKDVVSDKTPIGIIFHVEEAETLDDISNYNGVSLADNKVHGWVVALTQGAKTVWCSEAMTTRVEGVGVASSDKGDYAGYKNTQTLKTFAEKSENASKTFAALNICLNWSVKANSGVVASNWYLPAIGQFSVLKDNMDVVNASLAKVTDAQAIPSTATNTNHWSSTYFEGADIKIYQLQYNATSPATFKFRSEKLESPAGVTRPILTF